MSRYYDYDTLCKGMHDVVLKNGALHRCIDDIKILDLPTADVRGNVKAHWIDMSPTGDSRFMCSRCKWKEKVPTIMGEPIVWEHCPSCGAQMIAR